MIEQMLSAVDVSDAFQLLERGGPVVAILGVMSVVALSVGCLKLVQFLYLGVGRDRGVSKAVAQWLAGDSDGAIDRLSARTGAAPVVLAQAMRRLRSGAAHHAAREEGERIALGRLAKLKAHLRVIEATAQFAPLLGLFGTVLGMMTAFHTLQSAGADADPAALAGGIWVALITTAVGLAVAIPAGLALYWFEGRIEKEAEIMEDALSALFTGPLAGEVAGRLFHPGIVTTRTDHAAE